MNKIMLKMKVGAFLVFLLLLAVSVSATVTINNESMSTDDSDLELNYLDGWVNAWNMTVDNESIDASVINQWNMGYEHRGDAFFNVSDAFDFTWAITSPWNSSVSNPFNQELNTTDDVTFNSVSGDGSSLTGVLLDWTDGDPFYNGSLAYILQSAWFTTWNNSLDDWTDGDPFYNGSDAKGYTHEIGYYANNSVSNPFNQDLNESDDVVFNKITTSNITSSGALNITSDDAYTRVTGDLNVTGILSPTLFLIPCYGDPPVTVSGMMYFNTGNYSLVVYYDGAWHWHEED